MKAKLEALKKANRFRKRVVFDDNLFDLASNDYLGLTQNKDILDKTIKAIKALKYHAPRASMLVNGYTSSHKKLEELLCKLNGFESGMILGSGFLANIAIIESLCRQDTFLVLDSESHASAIYATKSIKGDYDFFAHNNIEDLRQKLEANKSKQLVIFVEGIYSMSGELINREIFEIADKYDAYLVIDEAHSSGVIGDNLLGVLDLFNLTPKSKWIKMGTFGKAYGSYGAYVLASKEVISYFENRAKPAIYSTALSVFDVELAYQSIIHVQKNISFYKKKIDKRRLLAQKYFHKTDALILSIKVTDDKKTIELKTKLQTLGYEIGAIRRPTVEIPIVRVILSLGVKSKKIEEVLQKLDAIC